MSDGIYVIQQSGLFQIYSAYHTLIPVRPLTSNPGWKELSAPIPHLSGGRLCLPHVFRKMICCQKLSVTPIWGQKFLC